MFVSLSTFHLTSICVHINNLFIITEHIVKMNNTNIPILNLSIIL